MAVNFPQVVNSKSTEESILERILQATQAAQKPTLTFEQKLTLAENMAKAKVFPSIENQYQALAAIEIGASLGMEPGVALMSIDFGVQGRPSINVHWQAGKMQELGWRWEFVDHNSETCHMKFFPPKGRGEPFKYQFSMTEAKAIVIYDREQTNDGKGASLGNKWNYKSWAADMLYAFIMRRIVRRHEPRILGGYAGTEEEETQQALEVGAYEGGATSQEQFDKNVADLFGKEKVNTATGEVTEQEAPADDIPEPQPPADTREEQPATDDSDAETDTDYLAWHEKVQGLCSENSVDLGRYITYVCQRYDATDLRQLSEKERESSLYWLKTDGGRKYLEKEMAKAGI